MAKHELVDARPSNAARCCQKMAEFEGDETRPRGCNYPTPLCMLAKTLRQTTMDAQFCQIENASPTTNTLLTFSTTNILCPCMCTPENARVRPQVLASGPKACRVTKDLAIFWLVYIALCCELRECSRLSIYLECILIDYHVSVLAAVVSFSQQ